MKTILILLFSFSKFSYCQKVIPKDYANFILKADSLYKLKKYNESGLMFSKAFFSNNDMGLVNDRYNAACSWALAKKNDSAFVQLYRIATKGNFKDLVNITNDKDLLSLHFDKKWPPLLELIKKNQNK